MSELDGTGVGEYVVVVLATATGPMSRSHTSSKLRFSCRIGLVGLAVVDPLYAAEAVTDWSVGVPEVV